MQSSTLNQSFNSISKLIASSDLNIILRYLKKIVPCRVSSYKHTHPHFEKLEAVTSSLRNEKGPIYDELKQIIAKLDLNDLNRATYRCDQEERDMGEGSGTYNIPGYGSLVYCGTQGFVSVLTEITPNNDLGHPFCTNLREGNWMIDYLHQRIAKNARTAELSKWIDRNTVAMKEIPRYLIPSYFDVFVTGVHQLLIDRCIQLMSPYVKSSFHEIQKFCELSDFSIQLT